MDSAEWSALDHAAALRRASAIADEVGIRLLGVRSHAFAGRRGKVALFDVDGTPFAFVPGGPTTVGFDAGRFAPDQRQRRSFAAVADQLNVVDDIQAYVAARTSPARQVVVPSLLVAVSAVDAAAVPAPVDDPMIVKLVTEARAVRGDLGGQRHYHVKSAGRAAAVVRDDWTIERAWFIRTPTHAEVVERLAREGRRLLTADEWEHACGAGATTLFRWGDTAPRGASDTLSVGPHREPNLFGLQIGQNPYDDEWTAEPAVARGGDGGAMAHSGIGGFPAWLTLATAYRDPYYEQFLRTDSDLLDRVLIRPAIPVP
ncbi:hypothetical protein [Asanoa iriomotensis]|uniref:Formylglycine-generating enzyme required for sulfatase activity n=1 Tax=Asanoa iriomotensis TaxID=234613 RepID=A0ABQ4BXC3_9ACTN|nr:hypothetical protein [Asanoa iriomotensis]GIF55186.1 hypothetical protein Air01nite_12810 [Asanoa iriomotensis]